MTMLSGINYNHVMIFTKEQLKDFNSTTQKEFLRKYSWMSTKDYRETKKHLKRIGVI